MNEAHTRLDLKRLLWNLNVNVADYAHPAWTKHSDNRGDQKGMQSGATHAKRLIVQYKLTFVSAEQMADALNRLALLDVRDLHRLARWGATLAAREDLRLCVSGNEMRDCIRVMGNRMFDQGIKFDQRIDWTPFDQLGKQCRTSRLPLRLLEMQRRLVRAMCDEQAPGSAQRMRLRFRPGYFDRVVPLDGARPLLQALLSMREHAELSERATCILT
ncbi:hypothetical protein [Burkholderia ubonensis]|uniref:hypothetical protein n=1 Tax=Burkholderia ubonensis TaxID=101571 RepID=UPI000AAF4C81|nr:hypothetical protein [Burkholderia ubonensis]